MSTLEDREWDAELDARTVHGACGRTLNHCDCDDEPDGPILCEWHEETVDRLAASSQLDPDARRHIAAAFARICDDCEPA